MALFITACNDNNQAEIKTVEVETTTKDVAQNFDSNASYAKVEFGIDGMTCAMGCAKTIEKKMAKMEGVKTAKVDFDKRLAMVEYDESKVSPKSLEEAVVNVSEVYKVKDMKVVKDFNDAVKTCKADCKMACCTGDAAKDKVACAKDCEKECCKKTEKS